jgi:NodT family efflux transporter outer membrane factor (OMF) lipoprotein
MAVPYRTDVLIDAALAGSPDLAAAAARLRTAHGLAQQAGAALLPSVNGLASVAATKLSKNNGVPAEIVPDGFSGTGSLGVGLSLDLDLWGRNRAALRAARLGADAARFESEAARLALTTGIAATYADLAALHAQRDTLEAALGIRSQTLDLVEQRRAQGLDNAATARQARGRLEQTRADLAATDEAIGLARNALAALAGRGPDFAARIGRPSAAALGAQGLPADAAIALVGRRPDIAAARTRADAAAQQIKVARADFYPNVSLNALAGVQSFGLSNLFLRDSVAASAGPAMTLPIFRGGELEGQYRARRGDYDAAIAAYDATVIAALRETADALTSQRQLALRLADSRAALAEFEEANRLARLRYRNGLSTYLDVLAAEEGVLDSRLAVARLETRAFALDVALVRALGGGFQS